MADNNIDVQKEEYEKYYIENPESLGVDPDNIIVGECFDPFADYWQVGMEVEIQYTENGGVVIDRNYHISIDEFAAHFIASTDDVADVEAFEEDIPDDSFDIPDNLTAPEKFESVLLTVKRDGIEDLIDWCQTSDFYDSPASTRYHGCYPGGLVEHSLAVFDNLWNLYQFSKQLYPEKVQDLDRDSMVLVALLHDICKVNTYETYQRNVKNEQGQWEQIDCYRRNPKFSMGHGGKSVFIIQQFIKLTAQEAQAIYWHMGGFDISNYDTLDEMGQSFNENNLAFLLHQADMMTTYITENEITYGG